jgi:2',3'-cyclic-nucleotide 2'-phosphodiesterase (5'-nucleotidase family)
MKKNLFYLLAVVFLGTSCSNTRKAASRDDGRIDVTFVQVNDVYEIAPLEAGKSGGLARIATLKKRLLAKNQNTFLVIAGDFLSPSVYNSLKYEGVRIRGRQMVETMNAAGMDLAVFGNHEFDITENELQSRINESAFQWVSSNTFHKSGNTVASFVKSTGTKSDPIPETYIITVRDADGTVAKIGFIGITLPFTRTPYVSYTDPLASAEKMYNQIKDSVDAVVAVTHQAIADDIILAQRLPGLAMIIGGHEHDRRFQKVGNVIISKAHANAKSAYILNLEINKRKNKFKVSSQLEMVDESIPFDSATDVVVKKWTAIAEKNYASIGFNPARIIMATGEPLEGRETEIRRRPTNLSRLIVAAMESAAPQADIAIVNTGSIRLDDVLQMPVTEYDILRALPFGGSIVEVDMKGVLLSRILEAGRKNSGIGGYLVYSQALAYDSTAAKWNFKEQPLDLQKIYRIALTDFLLTGGEANLDFLNKDNPAIVKVYPVATQINDPRSDIRLAIVKYLDKIKQ